MQIALKARHVRLAAGLIARNMDLMSGAERLPGEADDAYRDRVGRSMFARMLAGDMAGEAWALLADIAGMTPDELDDQPPDAPLDIVSAVISGEDGARFFAKVRALLPQPEVPAAA